MCRELCKEYSVIKRTIPLHAIYNRCNIGSGASCIGLAELMESGYSSYDKNAWTKFNTQKTTIKIIILLIINILANIM